MADSNPYLLDFIEDPLGFSTVLKNELEAVGKVDLEVENAMDLQHKRMTRLLRIAPRLKRARRERLFRTVMDNFDSIIEDTDWKCRYTEDLHKGLEKCLGNLDDKIAHFKVELETAKPGVTEKIEKKVAREAPPSPPPPPPPPQPPKRRRRRRRRIKRASLVQNIGEAQQQQWQQLFADSVDNHSVFRPS